MRVLLVDDDAELRSMLAEYLTGEGLEVGLAADGEQGLAEALSGRYALVVLDIMMPGRSGIDVLRELRRSSAVPVIMLTARGDGVDRVIGLELGADDYMPKPCLPRELVARIRAVLRRSQTSAPHDESGQICRAGQLSLFVDECRAEWQDRPLELTISEFKLLHALIQAEGRVLSKSELCERALGRPFTRYDRTVDVHLSNLRQKLEPIAQGQSWIHTLRGVGYKWLME